ncbi:MAG: YbhB/YbcL family Raf kinase inhibitor-like protein [Candidatus Omnitrophica bacterium]|nr:YbhB/YbcL family Raf kinase inhibitor-like protein [Candidatus Omnitrophota bacterium]
MKITSPDFKHNARMPSHLTCDGADVSPVLDIDMVPAEAKSLALIVDDPDAPKGTWDHWIIYNIPPDKKHIWSGEVPGEQVMNSFQKAAWGGPCPPSGTHRYFFKLYALDRRLNLGLRAYKNDLEAAMAGHILAQAELIGLYQRQ